MKIREKQHLDTGWQMGVIPHLQAREQNITSLEQLSRNTGLHPAVVPGCMEHDLQKAGLLEDPYFGLNILKVQELEDCHAYYGVSFSFKNQIGAIPQIVFEGLDTICEIYLNGTLLGKTDNMMIAHRFDLRDIPEGENELFIHFLPSCITARDFPLSPGYYSHSLANYEMLRLRKPPHMFGWDIAPRAVSAGIWLPVFIEFVPTEHIEDCFIMTFSENGEGSTAVLDIYFDLSIQAGLLTNYKLRISGVCEDSHFETCKTLRFTKGVLRVPVPDAKLWWPKGYGLQSLYRTTIQLICGEQVIDTWEQQAGIRTVKLNRTAVTDVRHLGKFEFIINKEKVFVMGTNWVPLDAFHCNDINRVEEALELTDDIGCNAIRCWGGNVYESELFYNICDQKGLMVWQDFALACAVYPQDDLMFAAIKHEVTSVVKRLRRHPSIILWAGDNECDLLMSRAVGDRDPNISHLTRKIIKDLIEFEDPTRPYLPSSPFYDEEAYQIGRQYITENHLWGPRDYYKSSFYTQSLCHFVSEIGYQGCPSTDSVKKFISAENLWPWQDNPEWIVHAANDNARPDAIYAHRIRLMANQVRELFGSVPDNLDDFSLASQISQAEAMKFFIELFRQQRAYRTGIIWWNILDCWPQFSDAVVDYYFVKKLAYYFIKRSQQPFILLVGEPSNWKQPLLAINDSKSAISFTYRLLDAANGQELFSGEAKVEPNSMLSLQQLDFCQGVKRFYIIEWQTARESGINHYLAGNPPFDLAEYCDNARKYHLI